jgi:hypothetical protein
MKRANGLSYDEEKEKISLWRSLKKGAQRHAGRESMASGEVMLQQGKRGGDDSV